MEDFSSLLEPFKLALSLWDWETFDRQKKSEQNPYLFAAFFYSETSSRLPFIVLRAGDVHTPDVLLPTAVQFCQVFIYLSNRLVWHSGIIMNNQVWGIISRPGLFRIPQQPKSCNCFNIQCFKENNHKRTVALIIIYYFPNQNKH